MTDALGIALTGLCAVPPDRLAGMRACEVEYARHPRLPLRLVTRVEAGGRPYAMGMALGHVRCPRAAESGPADLPSDDARHMYAPPDAEAVARVAALLEPSRREGSRQAARREMERARRAVAG